MKNTAVNGYDCPYCRTQMAELPDEEEEDSDSDSDSESEADSEIDAEEEEEYILMGFRWFSQQINHEELEGDESEYMANNLEESSWNVECEKSSEEVNEKMENLMNGLKKIKALSYEDLVSALMHVNLSKSSGSSNLEEAYKKVQSTIESVWERTWASEASIL
jgi:hypothetical protein